MGGKKKRRYSTSSDSDDETHRSGRRSSHRRGRGRSYDSEADGSSTLDQAPSHEPTWFSRLAKKVSLAAGSNSQEDLKQGDHESAKSTRKSSRSRRSSAAGKSARSEKSRKSSKSRSRKKRSVEAELGIRESMSEEKMAMLLKDAMGKVESPYKPPDKSVNSNQESARRKKHSKDTKRTDSKNWRKLASACKVVGACKPTKGDSKRDRHSRPSSLAVDEGALINKDESFESPKSSTEVEINARRSKTVGPNESEPEKVYDIIEDGATTMPADVPTIPRRSSVVEDVNAPGIFPGLQPSYQYNGGVGGFSMPIASPIPLYNQFDGGLAGFDGGLAGHLQQVAGQLPQDGGLPGQLSQDGGLAGQLQQMAGQLPQAMAVGQWPQYPGNFNYTGAASFSGVGSFPTMSKRETRISGRLTQPPVREDDLGDLLHKPVPNKLAIASFLFCCLPLSLVGLHYAVEAKFRYLEKNEAAGDRLAASSKIASVAAMCCGMLLVSVILAIFFLVPSISPFSL